MYIIYIYTGVNGRLKSHARNKRTRHTRPSYRDTHMCVCVYILYVFTWNNGNNIRLLKAYVRKQIQERGFVFNFKHIRLCTINYRRYCSRRVLPSNDTVFYRKQIKTTWKAIDKILKTNETTPPFLELFESRLQGLCGEIDISFCKMSTQRVFSQLLLYTIELCLLI